MSTGRFFIYVLLVVVIVTLLMWLYIKRLISQMCWDMKIISMDSMNLNWGVLTPSGQKVTGVMKIIIRNSSQTSLSFSKVKVILYYQNNLLAQSIKPFDITVNAGMINEIEIPFEITVTVNNINAVQSYMLSGGAIDIGYSVFAKWGLLGFSKSGEASLNPYSTTLLSKCD